MQRLLYRTKWDADARLEAACRKATTAGDPSYRTIRNILAGWPPSRTRR
jgi:hypothetical protein